MFCRGVNYDVGIEFSRAYMSRPEFDRGVVERELAIVRDELHCDAVRISGTDPQRLAETAAIAVDLGLQVWVSPHLHDASPSATKHYMVDCAARVAPLADATSGMVFVVGCELTWFMAGILPGATFQRRLFNPLAMPRLKWSAKPSKLLNTWLAEAVAELRHVFPGPLTYAAAPIERIDWEPLDYVSLDYYRGKQNRDDYGARLQRHFAFGKPVFITELGLCTYRGAEDAGGRGWKITTVKNGRLQIKGHRQRDEDLQARELIDMLHQVETAGVAGAFVFTFVAPQLTHDEDPRLDLDMASYSWSRATATRWAAPVQICRGNRRSPRRTLRRAQRLNRLTRVSVPDGPGGCADRGGGWIGCGTEDAVGGCGAEAEPVALVAVVVQPVAPGQAA